MPKNCSMYITFLAGGHVEIIKELGSRLRHFAKVFLRKENDRIGIRER